MSVKIKVACGHKSFINATGECHQCFIERNAAKPSDLCHLVVFVDGRFAYKGLGAFTREHLEAWVKGPMAGLNGPGVTYEIEED